MIGWQSLCYGILHAELPYETQSRSKKIFESLKHEIKF